MGVLSTLRKAISGVGASSKNTSTANNTTSSGGSKTPTTITNLDGSSNIGYIQDGRTYYNDGSRIGEGAKVTIGNGTEYEMKNGNGVPTGNTYGVGRSANTQQSINDNISSMYDNQSKSDISALRQAIQKSISEQQKTIDNAPQTYQPMRNESEVQRYGDLRTALEQSANMGDRGGVGRQAALETQVQADNRLNNIDLQQQNLVNTAKQNIADIQSSASLQEQQINSTNAANKLKALIEQQQTAKTDFSNTINSQYGNFQAAIDKIDSLIKQGQVYDTDGISLEYKKRAYESARSQKILDEQALAREQDQQTFENMLNQQQVNYQTGKPYYKPTTAKSTTKKYTPSQVTSLYNNGWIDESTAKQLLGL